MDRQGCALVSRHGVADMVMAFRSREVQAAALAGGTSLVLIVGALLFQASGLPPCEMCHWQRWPHIAGGLAGVTGAGLGLAGRAGPGFVRGAALLAIAGLVVSGLLGVFHAGVEWDWWEGPTACASAGYVPGRPDAFESFNIVRCDVAAWRLFGLSLAGYNALISFAVAALGLMLLRRKGPKGAQIA